MSLQGKVALVTGASRGIGQAIALELGRQGAVVIGTATSEAGAERIAACWAENRRIPQIVYKPDWTRHKKAAPFRRNDQMLETLPIGLIAFPGSGITQNLADKARKMGVPVWRFGEGE